MKGHDAVALARQSPPEARPLVDVLKWPVLGSFLRWRHSRVVLSGLTLIFSVALVFHAFWGPTLAPKNLATLVTWVHFRGLVVLIIVLAGNLFCMACPFMLPRELVRKWWSPRLVFPAWLRTKWIGIALFVAVLFAYELFDLFAEPFWTGVLIVAYFSAALAVDSLFQRASFCKYLCPVGQFNFVCSMFSPLEVRARDVEKCAGCQTKDCIVGRRAEAGAGTPESAGALPIVQRGCELGLYQPRKRGNVDCTFCLDCVYACPHDNVGLTSRLPGEAAIADGTRSGIGALERRWDMTALFVVFTFGAILNAFAMISPVYALEQWIAERSGLRVEWPILLLLFVLSLVLLPIILLGACGMVGLRADQHSKSLGAHVRYFARSLVPLGFGIWLAHYGFHFFTGFLTVIPVTQNAVEELAGRPWLGAAQWQLGGLPESMVYPIELGFLLLGLVTAVWISWELAARVAPKRVTACFAPWCLLHLTLCAVAVWIMNQPMDMRGTFLGG